MENTIKVVVFGAGAFGRKYIQCLNKNEEIVAICDNKWQSMTSITSFGYKVVAPERIIELEFDYVVIAVDHGAIVGTKNVFEIQSQLIELGVPKSKITIINNDYTANEYSRDYEFPRVQFLYDFARLAYEKNIMGAVAECGVFWGDYAYHINKAFPDRKLFLFDTFEKFPESDIAMEQKEVSSFFSSGNVLTYWLRSDEVSLMKCRYRDNVILKKGYVPETFESVTEEEFVYVHLDMDLYAPTAAALKFFSPRMSKGGVIAIHDYFRGDGFFSGVIKAVKEFNDVGNAVPIGDGTSLAILF